MDKNREKTDSKDDGTPSQNMTSTPVEQGVQFQLNAAYDSSGRKLFPPPTSDPLDPLNWSSIRKHVILGIVMLKYFLFTYITTTTVPSFAEIQSQYRINYSQVNWTVAIPALGLAVGPLIWSSLGDIYGRRQVFLVGTLIALISTIGAAVAGSYGGYMAARFFQGFGVSPASTVGMAIVNDLFFEYERGQKLGLWVLAVDLGLLLGPTFGGFLNIVSADWVLWFNAILFAVLLILEVFFLPETLYPRQRMLLSIGNMPAISPLRDETDKTATESSPSCLLKMPAGGIVCPDIPRTTSLPFLTFRPIPGMRHPRPWDSLTRFCLTFQFPVVVIAVIGFSFTWYWWILSIITMEPEAYSQYTPLIQGLLFLGLSLGTIVSEICFSGRLSDNLVTWLTKRNGNIRAPEMRLWLSYPAIAITAFAAGIQMGNTAISSYIIDAYPLQSTSIVTFYAVFFNMSAFINPFFIAAWEAAVGWTWTFTTQALIMVSLSTLLMIILHKYGAWIREHSPEPSWVNPEYDLGISASSV
ncbi:hypothetical protein N7470_003638 [Penicillium chermesinum]|nr:hypothetical protein N7470_003638 [Penicillium chermesinum]